MKHRHRGKVKLTQRNLANLEAEYAEEVVRLRSAMYQAVIQLGASEPEVARQTLRAALAECWWI